MNNIKSLQKEYNYVEQDSKNQFNNNLVIFKKLLNEYYEKKEIELNHNQKLLYKLNPKEILKLGYASLKLENEYIISKKQVKKDDKVIIGLKDGNIYAKVLEVE